MKVMLKADWFGPDMKRYRVRDNPHTMPDELKPFLPSAAKVEEDPAAEETAAPKPAPVKLKI